MRCLRLGTVLWNRLTQSQCFDFIQTVIECAHFRIIAVNLVLIPWICGKNKGPFLDWMNKKKLHLHSNRKRNTLKTFQKKGVSASSKTIKQEPLWFGATPRPPPKRHVSNVFCVKNRQQLSNVAQIVCFKQPQNGARTLDLLLENSE